MVVEEEEEEAGLASFGGCYGCGQRVQQSVLVTSGTSGIALPFRTAQFTMPFGCPVLDTVGRVAVILWVLRMLLLARRGASMIEKHIHITILSTELSLPFSWFRADENDFCSAISRWSKVDQLLAKR